ncbi:putative membrane protein YcfT [Chitinophaga skermanii]|uniref:Putative membrane protein YcfT n=1 Tax=Chitinophaga skermanii TaxID=331697 RepID=A0A327QRP3_9BACT|nr:acyltransferase [Chitinophaga skermanii]RAJ06941.1 putative membrane protein YcfT [Chitinophaga skermanii]
MKFNLFNSSIVNNSRLPWVDYARGIAIILVLYRHIFEGFLRAIPGTDAYDYLEHANIIFYSFRMPLFFILSGVFIGRSLAKRSVGTIVKNKFNILLWPYLVWSVLQVTLQIALSKYVNADRTWHDYTYIALFPRRIDQFWYLYALFNVTVLYVLLRQKLKIGYQLLLGAAMYFTSSYLTRHQIDIGFVYDILHYYMFFAFGDLIADYMLNKEKYKLYGSWQVFGVLLPIFIVGQYYFLQENLMMKDYEFVEAYQPILFIVIAVTGCAFMVNIAFMLQQYNVLKALRVVGYHSMYIYVCHVLVASATRVLLVKAGMTYIPLMLAICLVTALIVPIIVYNIAMQIGAWWLYSLERPEKKTVQPNPQLVK